MTRRTEAKAVINLFDTTAKKDGEYSANDVLSFCELSKLDQGSYSTVKYATLEDGGFFLDGSCTLMNSETSSETLSYWSSSMSDEQGLFTTDASPTIERSFNDNHSSAGLTLCFDSNYPLPKKITVFFGAEGGSEINSGVFKPDDYVYFCDCKADNYKYLKVVFDETEPYQYARVNAIEYGAKLEYSSVSSKRITKATLLEELDMTSSEVSVNTSTLTVYDKDELFSIDNPQGYYSLLQEQQKVELYSLIDGVEYEMATHYIKSWGTESGAISTFEAQDILGVMDGMTFKGNLYVKKKASIIIDEIMNSFGWEDYYIDDEIGDVELSGVIAPCTHREALQQVVFACCGVIDTSRVSGINIYKPSRSTQTTISSSRKFLNPSHSIKQTDLITDIEITAHNYSKTSELKQVYKATLPSGNYTITLSTPATDYVAENCTINASGYYFLDITVSDEEADVLIKGVQYEDNQVTFIRTMEELPSGSYRNAKSVTGATLVSNSNAKAVAENLYYFYQYRLDHELKIVCEDEKVGNYSAVKSKNGMVAVAIERLEMDLAGGFLATLKGRGYALKMGDYNYSGEYYSGEEMGVI